ncbi:MAG: acetate--CoA ligase family protein, partial [Xanthobacteraceae bacterium]
HYPRSRKCMEGLSMGMHALLDPKSVAVVGASQRPGRGSRVIANLHDAGFAGEICAVNPRYPDVLGYKCYPGIADLPSSVDCLLVAVGADAACDVLEQANARGIKAAIVLSAGFGEGGRNEARASRLRKVASEGMAICGPNCFGLINVRSRAACFSGVVPRVMVPGPVALVSQSGSLGNFAFGPLMRDRKLGFSHFISCGNQTGTTVEDYIDHLVDDPDVTVIAAVIEALKNPRKLAEAAQRAHRGGKSLVFCPIGRSAAGQTMIRSHTGALAGDAAILGAFLRRCGIVQAESYDEFVETIELLAVAPRDPDCGREVVLVSGSGGGAAVATDHLDEAGLRLAQLEAGTRERLAAVLPDFASVGNPIDATGVVYDDPALLPNLFDAILSQPGRPIVAASVIAAPVERMRRIAGAIADVARASGRTIVAYQPSPLGPIDEEIARTLHAANVPLLLGIGNAMGALRHLATARDAAATAAPAAAAPGSARNAAPFPQDFLGARDALVAAGVPVTDATLAGSAQEAVALMRRFAMPVALKAEADGLLHKSDLGCVRLGCATDAEVIAGYDAVIGNARKAGFETSRVLVQPMMSGVAECYAGIIDDPLFGPAVCFGLGGIFVELFKDTIMEMAPLTREIAARMIGRVKAAAILNGARGRPPADTAALAHLLVRLSEFAAANAGRFRALDLNPIVVGPAGEGALAVDIAVEPANQKFTENKP